MINAITITQRQIIIAHHIVIIFCEIVKTSAILKFYKINLLGYKKNNLKI